VNPPVVTITCPSCGGKVTNAELGDRTTCKYCGTELHLPTVGYEPPTIDATHGPEPSVAPRRRAPSQGAQIALVLIVTAAIGGFAYVILRQPTVREVEGSGPSPLPRDPELANVDCTMACNKPCFEIKDPSLMVSCMNKCEDKCKFVGKGTPSECRARCDTKCAGAPDPASLGACKSSCVSACPN
jgi:hypothetical protein